MRSRGPLPSRYRFAPPLAAGLALALAVLASAADARVVGSQAAGQRSDVVTASQDALRTGWDPTETAMTAADVTAFQQLFNTTVSGQVYAEPLVIGPTVVVATEDDWVYGLDAATGAVQWSTRLGTPFNITKAALKSLRTCTDLVPDIGATGTPVYDPGTGDVYLFAQAWSGPAPSYYLFGIDPANGSIVAKKRISGHPSNDPNITFRPRMQMERPGALLLDGVIYGAFASHCDVNPYAGYVTGVNVSTLHATLWTDESTLTGRRAGIWQSGGGLMSDGSGRIFVASGNGVSPGPGGGTAPPGQLAESVIRLGVKPDGSLSARDFFSPANAPALDAADLDLGGGGPVGLPFGTSGGTSSFPDVLAQAGKDGRIFLLNRDSLGGRKQGPGLTDADLSVTMPYGGEWGHPAVFADTSPLTAANAASASNYLYHVSRRNPLRVFKFGVNAAGDPVLSDVANSSLVFGFSSGSPTVTSNGADPTTPVVWLTYAPSGTGANAMLEAYDVSSGALSACSPSAPCSLAPIWTAPIGTAGKFSIPATSGGRVYVGTRDGHVYGFGAPPPAAPVTGASAAFGQAAVSSATSKTVSVTAADAVTVTGVAATTSASNSLVPASQFTVGQVTKTTRRGAAPVPVTFPVTLARGDQLHAAVTFRPAAPGGADGTLTFSTQSVRFPAVDVPLTGDGTRPGLDAEPGAADFALASDQGLVDVPVGTAVPQLVDVTNYGTTTDVVTSVSPPSGPFTAVGLPRVGTPIRPGRSIPVQVTFAPTAAGPVSGSFTISGSAGPSTTVTLRGVGTGAVSRLTAARRVMKFGTVRAGKQVTRYVHVTNSGNTPATVTRTAPVPAPFAAPLRPERNLPFNPSNELQIPVIFRPKRAGTFTAHYKLTWTDLLGPHTLDVVLTGTAT